MQKQQPSHANPTNKSWKEKKREDDNFLSVSGRDDPMVGEKPVKGGIGNDHQPDLRLQHQGEQGPLLLHQDHVVVVEQEKELILQSSL